MRETWFLRNLHTRDLALADLDKAPAMRPNETVDILRYHTKHQIEQSESLRDAINSGWIRLIKRRDNDTVVKTTPNDINISIENAEIDESVRYFGSMYADEANIDITVSSANIPYKISSGITGGAQNGIVFQNGHELRVVIPGTYFISWSIACGTGSASQEIMGAILKNGARQPNGTAHTTTAAANKDVDLGGSTIFPNLVAGNLLALSVSNETAAADINIEHINFVMLRLCN